jgi:hypothetical protein
MTTISKDVELELEILIEGCMHEFFTKLNRMDREELIEITNAFQVIYNRIKEKGE